MNYKFLLVSIIAFFLNFNTTQAQKNLDPELKAQVQAALKENGQTIRFMKNNGQIKNPNVLYYFGGKNGSVFIEKNKLVFVASYYKTEKHNFLEDESVMTGKHTFTINFEGANENPLLELGSNFRTKYNFFTDLDSSNWTTGVQASKELTLSEIYPGINLRLYSTSQGELEFDWVVKPEGDYSKIKMSYDGVDSLSLQKDGSLRIGLRESSFSMHIPESYQVSPVGKIPAKINFVKEGNLISFDCKTPIIPGSPLIIDPTLVWGTFMDGNGLNGDGGGSATFDQYLFAIQLDTLTSILYAAGACNLNIPTNAAPYDANGYRNVITGLNGGSNNNSWVTIVYRINNTGGDLIDLTLYGRTTISAGNQGEAHSISLSPNRVFIGGFTNDSLPITANAFDNTRNNQDSYIAVFNKALDTLVYASYMGSSGLEGENLGVQSIQALSDTTYVLGFTPVAALPTTTPNYLPDATAYDITFGGVQDMYICKFSSLNTMSWGTYIGGTSSETFNDLEVFPDGRITFAGWGSGTLPNEVNGAAASSAGGDNDGIIGVLSSNGKTMTYLDKIGSSGNDRIMDIEPYGSTLYWTGAVGSGFPLGSGTVYDNTFNGGVTDIVVGKVSDVGGSGTYKATFYGPTANGLPGGGTFNSDDLGNGIKQVSNGGSCGGTAATFLLIWGTIGTATGANLPCVNLNGEPYFDNTGNGAIDMFFAGFKNELDSLKFGTYVGGNNADYLGETGDPRGANHLFVYGSNIYVGTTTHSTNAITPTSIGGTAPFGGFDINKSNTNNDSHIIFEIGISSIVSTDFGDAPAVYGTPLHKIDCENLYIGNLDSEPAAQYSTNADGDDVSGIDDEDGVTSLPTLPVGGPQTVTVTVNNIHNTTGKVAHLYGWLNFENDTRFKNIEGWDTILPDGFIGNVTFAFTNITITNNANNFLRIRLTTNDMQDDPNTINTDERAYIAASDGEVEDYLYGVFFLSCPPTKTEASCQTQGAIDTSYTNWLNMAAAGGGCNGVLINDSNGSPNRCGATKTVKFTYANGCTPPDTITCTSTFTVTAPATLVLTCPSNKTDTACQTQAQITTKYNTWLASVTGSGGCNSALTNNSASPPSNCGEVKTVIFKIKSDCGDSLTCSRTYTVPNPPTVSLTCPTAQTEVACQTQATIDSKFTTWLNSATKSGGCNGVLTNNNSGAPSACGGAKTVTFTYTSTCAPLTTTCSATFTVTAPTSLVLTCHGDTTVASCKTQGSIDTLFTNWKNYVSFSGGCSPVLTTSAGTAPPKCGGSTTLTFTVTSSCGATLTCTKTFTVTAAPVVVLTCPSNQVELSCQTQTTINSKFSVWLANAVATGGCGTVLTNNNSGAPDKCGGTATVIFTATSSCEAPVTCSRTFTVNAPPTITLNCPSPKTETSCQTQAAINASYATWLASANFSGGCNSVLSNNSPGAPDKCGGTATVTYTVTSTCAPLTTTCSATFTVTTAPTVTLNCPSPKTEASCQTQAAINASYATWLASANFSGGCNTTFTNNSPGAPDKCGGAATVTFTVTSSCTPLTTTCSATFTVTTAPAVVLTCAVSKTEDSCLTQTEVNNRFTTWLATTTKSGGCNAILTNNNSGAPNFCGGAKTVTFTVNSDCESAKTCTATYTMPTDHAPGITGKLDSINVNGGCSISYLPTPYTTVAQLESNGLNITDCTPDANLVVTNEDLNASGKCPLNVTRVYYVTDACNNSSSATQVITIQDTIKPTFTKPADFQMYKGNLNPDNATLVNYDFDAGTSYATLCPIVFSGITTNFNSSSNTYATTTGVLSGSLAFAKNLYAGNALKVDSSHLPGFWQIDLKGANLPKCTDFGVYVQAFKNATKSADTLKYQYSSNGITWNTFRTTTLTQGSWVQDTGLITGVANPDSLFIRVTYAGGATGIGNKALYIDNLQVKSKVCCVYEATPFITGDVTDEMDNCATNLLATFCDSVTTEPCSGSTKIYRKWMLEDSCGNAANPQTQTITISDTSRPTFVKPADITLYNGVTTVDTQLLAHFNFNRGQSYGQLVPRLYYGINATIDTGSNLFKIDTGVKTSTLAFYNDTIAGRSLRVDSSNNNGYWKFRITGTTLPICSNFEMYLQTKKSNSGSADTVHYEYSLDSINYTRFKSTKLTTSTWIQDTAKIPINVVVSKLFVRIKYSSDTGSYPKKLLIDNFQLRAIVNYDSCSVDASPDVTGWGTDLKDNCDPYPSLKYEDVIVAGSCPKNYVINRTWKAIDDCNNEKKELQIITVKDTTAPTITCPPNLTLECGRSTVPDSTGYATGDDYCDTSVVITYSDVNIPGICPGDYTIQRTWKATDDCDNMKTCVQTIDIDPKPGPFLTCPVNQIEASCQTQSTINSKFTTWKNSVTYTGGCNPMLTIGSGSAPLACGGATTVTYTVTSDCGSTTCAATFTVTNAIPVVLTCPGATTEAACQTQAAIDSKFTTWKNSASFTGGCNAVITNSGGSAPNHCGGSTTITFTVNSDCDAAKTCTATFTVTTATPVTLTCPSTMTEVACQTQAAIDTKFATWKNAVTFIGGCNPILTNSGGTAPNHCGGATTLTFTVNSDCDAPKTCSATFTVTAATPVSLTCPSNQTEPACQTQAAIDSKFTTWKNSVTFGGGCNPILTNSGGSAPLACGGATTITFTVNSDCEPAKTCSATFTVTAATPVSLTCPANQNELSCQTQAAIDAKFTTWKNSVVFSGGCNSVLTNNAGAAPDKCGGIATITFTVTSDCEAPKTCNANFIVSSPPSVSLTCPANQNELSCQTQAAIDAKFTTWKNSVTFSGGCNSVLTNNATVAPDKCGGIATVTFTVTSTCEAPKTCSANFIVSSPPSVSITCPPAQTEVACQTQASIDSKFAIWKTIATFSGGCNGSLTNSGGTAPNKCGGATTVTFTVNSDCEPPKTCTATFTVTAATTVNITCPPAQTELSCQSQAAIDSKFAIWKTIATFSGGCNGVLTNSGGSAPNHCGGATTVTFTVNSDCDVPKTCSATFTVNNAPVVVLNCPGAQTEVACQTQATIDSKFNTWKNSVTFSGGCNSLLTNSGGSAPPFCGGSTTVTYTVLSDCEPNKTCSATFTVTNAPLVMLTCPNPVTENSCQTQATIDAKFAAWKNTASFSGGCNSILINNGSTPPSFCGGTATVTFTVSSDCEPIKTCNSTFTVTTAPVVMLTCPTPKTEPACQTQAAIDASFTAWKNTVSFSGGCNSMLQNNGPTAPSNCGGVATVTFTVSSDCEPIKTCNSTFTVTSPPVVVLTCPIAKTEPACQTQAAIDASFTAWKATALASGGCNGMLSNNSTVAPDKCGGVASVTFTYTSSCAPLTSTCISTFTVTAPNIVVISCPVAKTEVACQTQAAIDASFVAWKATANASGGCNGMLSNNSTVAPDKCGGVASVTFTYTSSCAPLSTTCNSTFTVTAAPPVVLTCPAPKTEMACQTQAAIDASFTAWKATASFTGGCNGLLTNSGGTAPDKCGGSTTITFTVTSTCAPLTTNCNATFTVDPAPPVVLTCPAPKTETACQTQAAIDASFAAWKATATFTGGCNGVLNNSGGSAPDKCGGSTTLTFTVTSTCAPLTTNCNATFTVDPAPPVVITCPAPKTEMACQTQAAIDASFAAWKATATFSGGCNAFLSNSGGAAPDKCGGSTTITFTVTSTCAPLTTNCNATFTVDPAPPVILTCPTPKIEPACQTQAAIDASFAAWKATTIFSGGCNGVLTNNTPTAPDKCGGTATVIFTLTSTCTPITTTCSSTFTVTNPPAVVLTCPAPKTEAACQTQAVIDASFSAWLATAIASGGCNGVLTNNNTGAPNKCGGSATIVFTYTSTCAPLTSTCSTTFTVTAPPPVVITCPAAKIEPACQTQAAIDASFATWKASATATGGCNTVVTPGAGSAPDKCGGSTTITWTANSDCDVPKTCSATFTVSNPPPVVLNCPAPKIEPACQTQAAIDASFAAWLTTATASGGCNGMLSNNSTLAPDKCGGVATVTYTYTSSCAPLTTTCMATFTVTNPPAVVITCPAPKIEMACQTQAAIDASFATWLTTASASGGCNGLFTNNSTVAPDKCGGSATITYTYTSSCAPLTTTCMATFTVDPAPAVVINCPAPKTEMACQTQAAIDASFTAWKATASFTGGCNGVLTNSIGMAPDKCGGSTVITFTVTSTCIPLITNCNATFTVDPAPAVVINCPAPKTEIACQTQAAIDASFAAWKATATFTGGCNGVLNNSGGTAPDKCGGSTVITFTVTSTCAPLTTNCNATFTVDPAPPVVITCPAPKTEMACQTQAAIDASFAAWKATATFTGGCNGVLNNSGGAAPDKCGGSTTITFTVTSTCAPITTNCNATFTVDPAPAISIICPSSTTEVACQTQTSIDNKFALWKSSVLFSGGCNGILSNSGGSAPNHCGGTSSVTFTVMSSCDVPKTCTASFTVDPAPAISISCPTNTTEVACQSQSIIDSKFAAWKNLASFLGGCNGVLTNNSASAPNHCGGTASVTFTVTSDCDVPKTCTASFTVDPAPAISISCPTSTTELACQTQTDIDNKFNAWKNLASFTGGCNGVLTNNGAAAPNHCGGASTITFTVNSDCDVPKTCSSTFTVNNATPVVLTCPSNTVEMACQSQSTIDTKFNAWKVNVTTSGGCNSVLTNNNPASPTACGGVSTIIYTVTSDCEPVKTCSATFTVTASPSVVLNCPINVTENACQSQSTIDTKFAAWKNTVSFSGGCNSALSNSGGSAPLACGGSTSMTFTVTSDCELAKTCTAVFTVNPAPLVVLNCPASVTEAACQSQTTINSKFSTWLATANFSGGCNSALSNSGGTAPLACGGATTVTYTVISDCESPKTCNATFTVTAPAAVAISCPSAVTEAACQTQTTINSKFATWLTTASFTGGCNGVLTNSGGTAPLACGGSTTVTFTVNSDCDVPKTCNATFTVTTATPVVLNCPTNVTENACQTQSTINSKFATWLSTVSFSGGCGSVITNNNSGAPLACGGTTNVTFTVSSDCEAPKTCNATFTVTTAIPVTITCPTNVTEVACQTQSIINSKFATWLTTFSTSGGCNPVVTNNNTGAPNACGGTTNVTFTVTSDCDAPKTCVASFTVTAASLVSLTCPINVTEVACQTQTIINSKYATWLATVITSGGCNPVLTNNSPGAPNACGGVANVTFTVTSGCEAPKTCTASFTVTSAPLLVFTCPSNQLEIACQTQATINSKFTTWKNSFITSGGCNPIVTNSGGNAPPACGGVTTITFSVSSDCDVVKTCTASFTVTAAPLVVLTCPAPVTEAACQTQASIDSKFLTWKNTFVNTGGCNPITTNSGGTAPLACGGATTITYTVSSDCEPIKTCSSTFTVTAAPAVVLTCPINATEVSCQTQAVINSKYATWLSSVVTSGGCNSLLTNNSSGAPNACGGSTTVTFTVTSSCETAKTCNASFTVSTPASVVLTCPTNVVEGPCQTQATINSKFTIWLATITSTGGCNTVITNNNTGAPNACGGSTTVIFTATSNCEAPKTCSAIFTVSTASTVNLTCPANVTEVACQTQTAINSSFATWLTTVVTSGGCSPVVTNNNTGAPNACGGSTTVVFTVTSGCEAPKTCSATFTVTTAPILNLTCPINASEISCQDQNTINSKYNTWLATFSSTGGCNVVLTNNSSSNPNACGEVKTVIFTGTSSCEAPKTCTATFTVIAAPVVVLNCPAPVTEGVCQTQATINSKYNTWLTTANFSGGCIPVLSNNSSGAPLACGGAKTVTFTVTSNCEAPKTCQSTFTVTNAPAVVLTCPTNTTEGVCQTQTAIDAKFTTWKNTVSFSGGCNSVITNTNTTAPAACGGASTITYTVTSDCEPGKTCTATFTVTNAPPVVLTCPANVTEASCQTQSTIDAKFTTWKNTVSFSGGCNSAITNSGGAAPTACGGATSVTFTVSSTCEPAKTCTSTFTVSNAPAVVLTCPANVTEASCQTQAVINTKFNTWLATVSATGGCGTTITNNNTGAPAACGGSVSVIFTATSLCENPKTCTATFTVSSPVAVALNCPANVTEDACQSQSAIDTKFSVWLNTVSATGGCGTTVTNNNTGAPAACGGSVSVIFTATSSCEGPKTCTATFTVVNAPPVVLTCPVNATELSCQTQTSINSKYATWLTTVAVGGGCNPIVTNNSPGAPSACGGSVTVVFTATSNCEGPKTCSATFTVNVAPALAINCPVSVTENDCQTQATIDSKYQTWLSSISTTGGCNIVITNNSPSNAPNACGEMRTVTFTIISSCETPKTCITNFNVNAPQPMNLACPADKTINGCFTQTEVNDQFNTWLQSVTVTGGCNPIISNNNSGAPNSCGGTKTVTFTAFSACLSNVTCNATFTISPLAPPTIICPPAKTINCNASTLPANTGFATGIDACNSIPTIGYGDVTIDGNCNSNYTINRSWVATDKCGNTSSCLQIITVQDTFKPSFTIPADVTIFRNFLAAGNQLLVNYNFNYGNSYRTLSPFLYSQITCKIDSAASVPFKRDSGVVTGVNAFAVNAFAGKGLKVTNSKDPGFWQFNIKGYNLPNFTSFDVYLQALRYSNGSAKTLLMDYSIDSTNWNNFSSTNLVKNVWTECKATIPAVSKPTKLFIRVLYSGGNDSTSKELFIDNFQVRAYRETDGCAFDDAPLKTGYPDNITHPCDPNPTATYVDSTLFAPCVSKVYRTWTVNDDCGNSKTSTIKQVITIKDTTGPVLTCPTGNLLNRKADTTKCYKTMDTLLDVKAVDACTMDSVSISNNYNNTNTLKGEKIPVGLHSITWTATDQCGNKSTCKYLLNVFETEPPIAKCRNNVTIYVGSGTNGTTFINIDSIDNGSTDNCAIYKREITPKKVDCDLVNQAPITLILTVQDSSGLTDTCQTKITVKDTLPPIIVCKNITINLPPSGLKIITADSVLMSSSDNCSIPNSGKVISKDTFTCTSPKVTVVTVTVTDKYGNKSTCTATVTISTGDGDCDGVNDVCDVCPKTDDRIDNDKDGKPDCNVIPTFANILASWKCSNNPQRVYISEIVNGICTTKCVSYATFKSTRTSNQYLGPCIMCPGLLKGNKGRNNADGMSLNDSNDPSAYLVSNGDFKIIPNPNFGTFEIVFDQPVEEGMLEIYNMLDEAVWKKEITNRTERIKMNGSELNINYSGVYWVIFKNKDTKVVKSMLITR